MKGKVDDFGAKFGKAHRPLILSVFLIFIKKCATHSFLGDRVMIQPIPERPGAVLKSAIASELVNHGPLGLPLRTKDLRRNRRLRGVVLVDAGEKVSRWAGGDKCLKRVGRSVVAKGWRDIAASDRTP